MGALPHDRHSGAEPTLVKTGAGTHVTCRKRSAAGQFATLGSPRAAKLSDPGSGNRGRHAAADSRQFVFVFFFFWGAGSSSPKAKPEKPENSEESGADVLTPE